MSEHGSSKRRREPERRGGFTSTSRTHAPGRLEARSTLARLLSLLALASAPALSAQVVTVAPGAHDTFLEIDGPCPTFSWADPLGAGRTELVVFDLGETSEAELQPLLPLEARSAPVLRVEVPPGTTTWSPTRDQCLSVGRRFGWTVRTAEQGETTTDDPVARDEQWSAFSAPRLFEVGVANGEELTAALRTVRDHLERRRAGDAADSVAGEPADPPSRLSWPSDEEGRSSPPAPRPQLPARALTKDALTGTAALTGEQTDGSGATVGVAGRSASPQGAGSEAANLGGGADLRLDGSADAEADAVLSHDRLDRVSSGDETFELASSGPGELSVLVDGQPIGTIVRLRAGSGLGGGASTGVATVWIAAPGVREGHLANGSVTGSEVSNQSLTEADFAAGSLQSEDIRNGHIRGEHLGASAVTAEKMASNAVHPSALANLAVTRHKLGSLRVVSVECKGECNDGGLFPTCTRAGSDFRAVMVDSHRSFSDIAPTPCGGDNECAVFDLDTAPLQRLCSDGDRWDCRVYCMEK